MKRNFFLVLLLFVANDLFPFWPGGKYASWIFNFQVDKTWKFDNDIQTWDVGGELNAGTSTVNFPGTIAWSFESWNDHYHSSDDYDMYWIEVYLRNGTNDNDVLQIVHVDIFGGNQEYLPRQILNYNNNTTYFTQARWYSYEYGSWLCYMVTEYSEKTRNFIERVGGNLQVKVVTHWDDGSWGIYSNADYVEAADRTFMTNVYPDKPSINNVAWTVNDGKTAIKYTHTVPTGCTFSISESYNNNSFSIPCSNSGTTVTEYIYPFDQSKYPTAAEMSGSVLKYNCYSSKYYQMDYSYYLTSGWNGKNDNGTTVWINSRPSSKTRSSNNTIFEAPQFAQAQNLTCVNQGNGEVKLSWKMNKCTGSLVDKSDIIIECATDANFTQNVSKTHVTYDSQLTNYSKIIAFSDRDKGNKDYYFRVYRANATPDNTVLTQKCSVRVNTNYAKITSFSGVINAQYRPVLKWNIDGGVCTDNMQLRLKYNGITQNLDLTQAKTMGEYVINDNLPTCDSIVYSIQVVEGSKAHGDEHRFTMMIPETMGSVIASYSVSKGFYNDRVQLAWQIDKDKHNFKHFQIGRKELNTNGKEVFLSVVDCKSGVFDYTYEDLNCVPGVYYQYTITGYTECGGIVNVVAQVASIGFAQPYGTVSGQITFNGNQGVPNVAINVVGEDARRSRSLRFLAKDMATLTIPKSLWEQMVGEEGTIEFYKAENGPFKHFAYTYNKNTYIVYEDGQQVSQTAITTRPFANGFTFESFDGFIDEIRVWNICRSQEEIQRTMNIYLNGSESGLTGYYRCDDEVESELFDISRMGTVFNEHHLEMRGIVPDQDNIPTTEQLALKTYTDKDGNYLINNVPYSVGGTLYKVIPTLGVHAFTPSSRPLYFNSDAATHNSIDFTDVSSFPVSGYVYYEGTDYPVEGCNFYVDGNACTMDNNIIESAADGSFTISVPIGEHYIEVRKGNHTFVLGGRYPEAVAYKKTTFNFQQPINNLTFYDNTLVVLTGRVAGGTAQDSLPHGMQLGKANIGQARIVISPETKQKYNLNTSETDIRRWRCPDSIGVASSAYTYAKSGSRAMRIAIDTDPRTGEFSALVPPIDMTVDSISIPSNPDIVFDLGSFGKIELSKAGVSYLQTDSALVDSVNYRYFKYTAKLDAIYRVNPQLIITDTQHDNGMMGIRQHLIQDPANDTVYTINIFEYDSLAQQWKYNFEVPFFLQGNTYTWHLRAFEQYSNYDKANDIVHDSVPVNNSLVTLYNELAAAGDTGEVVLDSTGCAYYRFSAGDPLKTAPHRLGLTVTYTDSQHSRSYDWDQNGHFQGVIMGAISNGSNFITEGPDHVLYVLRDPPGGGSFATLKTGTTITNSIVSSSIGHWSTETGFISHLGMEADVATGVGVMVINKMGAIDNLSTTAEYRGHTENTHTETATYTTTREVSTESDIYHVGSKGDVYIGYSTNRIFGEATSVTLLRDVDGTFYLGTQPIITVGEKFKTDFTFSQLDIESAQIPNLIKLRDALLETVSAEEYANPPVNKGKETRYITTLAKGHPQFGTVGTYKELVPEEMPNNTAEQDMVLYYNCQIDAWKARLADNEQAKVGMLEDNERKLIKNISIDGGATLTESVTTTSSDEKRSAVFHGYNVHIKNELGFQIDGIGEEWVFDTNGGGDWGDGTGYTEKSETTTSYTFDLNPYEQLTVNVYDAGDGFSPVYSTMGGQTACPYEDEEKTQYYEPGQYTLHVATQKMEDPLIRVVGASAFSAIPVGGEAIYTLELSNQTVVTSPVNMSLRLMEESNPNGAKLLVDDMPLNAAGVSYRFTGDRVITKTLTLAQGRPDVLEYKNIGIVLSSECSSRSIADTCYISATFIAACSDIALTTDTRIVNAERGGKLPMTISGYNVNLPTLTGCRLQYKQPIENNWHLIQEFSLEEMKTGTVHYTWDMSSINDGSYEVRAVTVCNLGGQEVSNESETINIVKNVTAPETLGLPSPINGIYTVDNQIFVDFNKDIQPGFITDACVDVSGVLNAHEQTHSVGLLYDLMPTQTQAEYDLSNTSFAFETWLNWSNEGFLLFHTMEGLQLEIMEDEHLRVIVDSLQWISKQTLPKDKWLYLVFNYELQPNGTGLMSAHCAYDDQTIVLFDDEPMPAYDRRGMLMVGYSLVGKMHDAILWHKSRDWATAMGERNISKDAYTDGILSYWPMDEGEGLVAHDIVRHRDMTLLTNNMWWYNNENKALYIPAGAEAIIDFSHFPNAFGNDYMFSFWFRTTAENETPFFRTSNGSLSFRLDKSEFIVETQDGNYRLRMGSQLNDGAWHHFAISSSHSFSPIILIDGEARNIATMDRQVFVTNEIYLNDTASSNALDVDEISVWKANCSSDYITDLYRNELRGNEPGLQAYFPMQETVIDDYGQTVTRFTLADKQVNYPELSKPVVIRNSNKDTLDATEAATAPPIREARAVEKVKHTYTASERRIVINITEEARRIEGCMLDLTVRNIVDVYGNYSTPINWSVYVNRNQLLWDEDNIRIAKDAINDTTFEVTIINNSGKTENWGLYNVPEWLSFDVNGGVLQPLSSRTLTATISPSLPIGNNQVTLYLIGNEGINQPLYLSVKVNAEQPNWEINPADYEYSMNVVALATINGHMADDSEDKVAAFINGKLAGVGSPKLFPAYNSYLIMMDVYANLNDKQRDSINHGVKIHLPVTFKYWDASTGIIYNRLGIQMSLLDTPTTSMDFLPGQMVGLPSNPVQLTSDKYIEQTISLTTGWNWISFNVLPDNNAFTSILNNLLDSLSLIKSQSAFAQLDEMRRLVGSLDYMEAIKAYKCRMSQPCDLTVSGQIPNPAYLGIPLTANGWSWVGYLPQTTLSVDAALANLSPSIGDIIKARSGFATWDGYKWVGSLTAMSPGNGYLYYNSTYTDALLYYPSAGLSLLPPTNLAARRSPAQQYSNFNPIDPTIYQGNMTMTAVVKNGEQIVTDAEVGIFAGDECRAAAVEKDDYWFITIPGENNVELTIKVATGGEIKTVKQTITYVDDAMIGSPTAPYIIQLDESAGFEELELQEDGANKVLHNGILYIKRNSKIYTAQGQLIE